jgi:hypothetical protein
MSKHSWVSSLAAVVFGILIFGYLGLFAANFRFPDGPQAAPFAGDFIQEYVGGYIVLYGDHSRFYDVAYAKQLEHDPEIAGFHWQSEQWYPMIYPPFYYLLFAPLSLLPIRIAALVWLGLMVAAFVASMLLLARHFPERTILPWGLPAGALFLPLLLSLIMDQKGTLLLLIFTATFVLLDRRQPFWAGLVFGLIAFKPHLALVIGLAMLCKSEWRFVAGSILTTNVLIGLCFVVGVDVSYQYFQLSLHMGEYIETPGYQLEQMHCWLGFFRLLLSGWTLQGVWIVTLIAWAITIALLARLLWGPLAYGRPLFAVQYSGLVLATILLSPHLLTYDLSPLLLPMILLIVYTTEAGSALEGHRRAILWFVGLLFVLAGTSSQLVPWLHVQPSVVCMFALLIKLAQITLRESPAGTPDVANA